MALVRAKTNVYLGDDGGYRAAGEEFEYTGPKNPNLEAVKPPETKPPAPDDK